MIAKIQKAFMYFRRIEWLFLSTGVLAGSDVAEVVEWLQRGPVERESLLLKMLSSVPLLRAPAPKQPVMLSCWDSGHIHTASVQMSGNCTAISSGTR